MGGEFFFKAPALEWDEGLPLGNGKLGAMFLSGFDREIIHLNEETLWSGCPRDSTDHEAPRYLEKVRALVREGRYRDAQDISERRLVDHDPAAYQPLGVLEIGIAESGGTPSEFMRSLDIEEGLLRVDSRRGGSMSIRRAFASAQDGLIAFRWETPRGALRVFPLLRLAPSLQPNRD
jgi:alpha-L-fucosidase 2